MRTEVMSRLCAYTPYVGFSASLSSVPLRVLKSDIEIEAIKVLAIVYANLCKWPCETQSAIFSMCNASERLEQKKKQQKEDNCNLAIQH